VFTSAGAAAWEVPLNVAGLQFPEKCNGEGRCVQACPREARMLWLRTAEKASHGSQSTLSACSR
jgi:hypothetical protein